MQNAVIPAATLWPVQIPQDHVFIVDDAGLQDGHDKVWNASLVSAKIAANVVKHQITQVRASSWDPAALAVYSW